LKVKVSKMGSLFIACTGFPECKTTFSLPKACENVIMTDEKCENCSKTHKRNVFKLKVEFPADLVNEAMSEILNLDDGTSGIFCVLPNCDPTYKTLLDTTYNLPNKRTFNDAFKQNNNGVPNYYY
jgi:ssDNA-binding Zn-finger/Zn-ribbon topoisomerase 1